MTDYYGKKSQLCTLYLHLHLKDQVLRHGALVFTSCFARESYIGQAVKWCLGKKYLLEQFITWYQVDRSLISNNRLTLNDISHNEEFHEKYTNMPFIRGYEAKFRVCANTEKIILNKPIFFSRYNRGLKTYHSRSYSRSGVCISYWTSIVTQACPMKRKTCFGDVVLYFTSNGHSYAFIKEYKCIPLQFANALATESMSESITKKLNCYYGFYNCKKFSYKIVPIVEILNKVITMKWNNDIYAYTDVVCEWEHN